MSDTLNVSVGVFGHVDSGKTSLVRALSTISSTACFDKSPQSKERGITLDLGFSAYSDVVPEHIKEDYPQFSKIEIALVDAPGHSSLFKTVIAGSQIIDMMILVIDATEGFQPQTGESLVLGETVVDKIIFAINKIDMLDEGEKKKRLSKLRAAIVKYVKRMQFTKYDIVEISANPKKGAGEPIGIDDVKNAIQNFITVKERDIKAPFVFLVDHCFQISGMGAVATGTVINGSVSVNDEVEIPSLGIKSRVRSLQMFRKPVQVAVQGSRVGMAFATKVDSSKLERTIISKPGFVNKVSSCVCTMNPIQFYKKQLHSGGKITVSISNLSVVATATYFSPDSQGDFAYGGDNAIVNDFTPSEEVSAIMGDEKTRKIYVHFEFVKPVYIHGGCKYISGSFDSAAASSCRLAYHGVFLSESRDVQLSELNLFSWKEKDAEIDRKFDDQILIGKNLFGKKYLEMMKGLHMTRTSNGDVGEILSSFGTTGKFKIRFSNKQTDTSGKLKIRYKKYYFKGETNNKFVQD